MSDFDEQALVGGFVSCAIGAADEDFHTRLGGADIPRWAFTFLRPWRMTGIFDAHLAKPVPQRVL